MSARKVSTVEQWMKFFKDAKIPKDYVTNYAIVFDKHRMRMDMLQDLNKDVLHDMGIKTMGDVIAIMRQAREVVEREARSKILEQSSSGQRSKSGSRSRSSSPVSAASRSRKVVTTSQSSVRDGPVIIDRRSAANLPSSPTVSSDAAIKRSIAGVKLAVSTARHRQEQMIQDHLLSGRFSQQSSRSARPSPSSVSSSTTIPLSLAKRLGPKEFEKKNPITAPGSSAESINIARRIVTGLDSGDHLSLSTSSSAQRVIRIGSGSNGNGAGTSKVSNNNSVFNRLGNNASSGGGGGKITATVKPTRTSSAPYSVHDRLGQQAVVQVDSSRKIVSSNLRVKSDLHSNMNSSGPSTSNRKIVSLKKSVFDRLN